MRVSDRIVASAMMRHVRTLADDYPHRHTGEPDEAGAV